jgi:hypothetical protein
MHAEIAELLTPLNEEERQRLNGAVVRLFANEDFKLIFRRMNSIASPFAAVMTGDGLEKAAARDGAAGHVRWLLTTYLTQTASEKPKRAKKQKTDTTP